MQTTKVKPWGKGQGDFVEINAEDFDPKIHTAFDAARFPPLAARVDPQPDDPLDHDGDGKAGGSVAGFHATATKGARKRKAARK